MSATLGRLSIEGPAGSLEAIVEDSAAAGSSYAVICHPHPLFGGTMDNKVVTTVGRALRTAGIPTLRFNFRGVGASAGSFDEGIGKTADAEAVASWGSVALRLAQQWSAEDRAPKLLITIAPAIARLGRPEDVPRCPWLVVQGDADDVVDPAAVVGWAKALDPRPRLVVLPGAGHFFHGRLNEVRDAVIDAVRSG
jgi:alpha/beta superfamily hydrolase